MKFQEYRIIEFDGEIKPGVDIPMVFEFLPFGSKGILKPPYKVIIHVNEFIGEVVYSECNCIDCDMKRNENCKRFAGKDYKCKHIKESEIKLIEDKHLTNTEKPKVVILDDNELSMACYAEEYPENFKAITESETTNIKSANNGVKYE